MESVVVDCTAKQARRHTLTAAEREAHGVVAAAGAEHDATQATADTLHDRAEQALADLRLIANSSGTLTGAQLSNAVRLLARVAIALVRLVIRRLDGTD